MINVKWLITQNWKNYSLIHDNTNQQIVKFGIQLTLSLSLELFFFWTQIDEFTFVQSNNIVINLVKEKNNTEIKLKFNNPLDNRKEISSHQDGHSHRWVLLGQPLSLFPMGWISTQNLVMWYNPPSSHGFNLSLQEQEDTKAVA